MNALMGTAAVLGWFVAWIGIPAGVTLLVAPQAQPIGSVVAGFIGLVVGIACAGNGLKRWMNSMEHGG